jgi:hypothetical protein
MTEGIRGAERGDGFDLTALRRFTGGVLDRGEYETGLHAGGTNVILMVQRRAGERFAATIRTTRMACGGGSA